jgi:ABC-type antimicrobial peptide transport system permease subunit
VGVVEDARHFSLKEAPLAEIFLLLNPQRPIYSGAFVVRAADPEAVLPQVTAAIRALAPRVPITEAQTGADAVTRASLAERFYAVLLSTTAAMGLALAILGLYGILSWSVASRHRELGVRAALGADRRRLALGVVREAVPTLVLGTALGAMLGWWAARLARTLLYEVQPTAPEGWLTAAFTIAGAAALAIALPCRRASRIAPADALRQDT